MLDGTTGVQTTKSRQITLFIQLMNCKEKRGRKKEEMEKGEEKEGRERNVVN